MAMVPGLSEMDGLQSYKKGRRGFHRATQIKSAKDRRYCAVAAALNSDCSHITRRQVREEFGAFAGPLSASCTQKRRKKSK
jgi:hypothetical protein